MSDIPSILRTPGPLDPQLTSDEATGSAPTNAHNTLRAYAVDLETGLPRIAGLPEDTSRILFLRGRRNVYQSEYYGPARRMLLSLIREARILTESLPPSQLPLLLSTTEVEGKPCWMITEVTRDPISGRIDAHFQDRMSGRMISLGGTDRADIYLRIGWEGHSGSLAQVGLITEKGFSLACYSFCLRADSYAEMATFLGLEALGSNTGNPVALAHGIADRIHRSDHYSPHTYTFRKAREIIFDEAAGKNRIGASLSVVMGRSNNPRPIVNIKLVQFPRHKDKLALHVYLYPPSYCHPHYSGDARHMPLVESLRTFLWNPILNAIEAETETSHSVSHGGSQDTGNGEKGGSRGSRARSGQGRTLSSGGAPTGGSRIKSNHQPHTRQRLVGGNGSPDVMAYAPVGPVSAVSLVAKVVI